MRIGLFTDQYFPICSGVVTSVTMLYDGFVSLGHEVYIFTSYTESDYTEEQLKEMHQRNVVNIYGRKYPFKQLKEYRYTFFHNKAAKVVKEYNLDIIHVHTDYNIAKVAIKCHKKYGIPVVRTLHTLFEDYLQYFNKLASILRHGSMAVLRTIYLRPLTRVCEYSIVPSEKVKLQAKKYALKDVVVIPSGIDINKFNRENFTDDEILELKKKLGIKENQFVFINLGRMAREKNITVILQAYKESLASDDNTVLLLAGGGADIELFKNEAKELGIENKVIFTGWLPWDYAAKHYRVGDCFVGASLSETQGLTYVEALASGVPLLIQDDTCLKGLFTNNENCVLFDGKDDLKKKMVEVYHNKSLLEKIRNVENETRDKYSNTQYAKNMLELYTKAIEKNNARKKK